MRAARASCVCSFWDLLSDERSRKAAEAAERWADALEDAGCDDAEVLGHCRGGGVQVRGCHLLDALLQKS